MSAPTADRARATSSPAMRRRAETWLVVVGMVLSVVFLGGFAVVMNRVDEAEFLATLYPELRGVGVDLARESAYEAATTMGAWFGFTLVTVLLLSAIGLYVVSRRPARRATGWWFAAAGTVCLIGSQLVLYPVAFLFFCAAGLFALRAVPDPRTPDHLPEHGSKR